MNSKEQSMYDLIQDLKNDLESENIKAKRSNEIVNVGLINHFVLHDLIPNKWFDWKNRVNASIMIIGQDWGPYSSLKKYIDDYKLSFNSLNFNYEDFLFKGFSSRTEKFILKVINQTYNEHFHKEFTKSMWNNFFFTMAVLYTRKGTKFRGSENFDEKQSQRLSLKYLKKQIEIVEPKVILTLGNLALSSVLEIFGQPIEHKTLTNYINSLKDGYIKINNTYIIPCYHPAAHINPKVQIKTWMKLWELIKL